MAWRLRFRRSIGNRFFRINFTKTGVGASAGMPGYRKSWHSSGRNTEHGVNPWHRGVMAERRDRQAEPRVRRGRTGQQASYSIAEAARLARRTVEDALELADDIDL